jgi:23S rRNA-/tRNA-specific pseudouridylate synthase
VCVDASDVTVVALLALVLHVCGVDGDTTGLLLCAKDTRMSDDFVAKWEQHERSRVKTITHQHSHAHISAKWKQYVNK